MRIVLAILGVLLMLFGGGCTLILAIAFASDPMSFFTDTALLLSIWLPLGLAPLAVGYWLYWMGRLWNKQIPQQDQTEQERDSN